MPFTHEIHSQPVPAYRPDYSPPRQGKLRQYHFNVILYPNPAHDAFGISSEKPIKEISVHDLSGRLILTQVVNDQKVSVPLSGYTTGIYFVSVVLPSNRSVTKNFV